MTLRSFPALDRRRLITVALIAAALLMAWYLGRSPSVLYVIAPLAVAAVLTVLRRPRMGLLAIIASALLFRVSIGTGSEVALHPVVLVVPALAALWLLVAMLQKRLIWPRSPVHLPLVLFLAAGLLSIGIGNLTWDTMVPRKDNFFLVQWAQWAIFAFSAVAFWLTAMLANSETWLKRMTLVYLILGACLALLRIVPPAQSLYLQISSGAVDRAPFWLLLVALAGGQLLFNRKLHPSLQLALVALIGVAVYFAFFLERKAAAYWVGIAAAGGVLVWLRFPRLRMPIVVLAILLLATGAFSSTIWSFAGGDDEWAESGASRLTLIERVVEVTMRNPVTGLGPAAYRLYANVQPLQYGRAYWVAPLINSHNNYVDLFAHTGLVGLALFLWFMVELALAGWRLHRRYRAGFIAGYVNGMLAVIAGTMVIMFLLDWFLPFVYNVGFFGFQASVLVWLFLGGLVAIEDWSSSSAVPNQR